MQKRKSADDYYRAAASQWKNLLIILREIVLNTELQETEKWGMPTYHTWRKKCDWNWSL